ncbi:MAG: hypothetical protein ACQEP3_01350 [Patescibacteria group bacterium]
MEENLENFIDKKVEEILASPSYKNIEEDKRKSLKKEIQDHLERMVIETFVNRLSEEEAEDLNKLMQKDGSRAHKKLKELAFSTPELANDLEQRINREVEKFKSLKS